MPNGWALTGSKSEEANTKYQLLHKIQAHREWQAPATSINAKTHDTFLEDNHMQNSQTDEFWTSSVSQFVSGTELLHDPPYSVLFASPPPSGPFSSPQYDIVQPDPTGMQQSS